MAILAPFNLKKWVDENRDLLKPPVGNKCIYQHAENFIVMIVGGPNARKDYHYNESEELYFQHVDKYICCLPEVSTNPCFHQPIFLN